MMDSKHRFLALIALMIGLALLLVFRGDGAPDAGSIAGLSPEESKEPEGWLESARYTPPASFREPFDDDSRREGLDSGAADGASASTAESEPCEEIALRVLTSEESLVPDARVFLRSGREWDLKGRTDDQGAIDLCVDEKATIIIKHPEYATKTAYLTTPLSADTVDVVITRAATIRGRVLLPGGAPCGAGAKVYAWRAGYQPNSGVAFSNGSPARALGHTNDKGEFCIQNLHPDFLYCLTAGGKGLASARWLRNVPAGSQDLELSVEYLYGCSVQYISSVSGEVVRPYHSSAANVTLEVKRDLSAKIVYSLGDATALSGFSPRAAGQLNPKVYLYRSSVPPGDTGIGPPVKVSGSFLGYAEFREYLRLEWMAMPMPEYVVELQPLHEKFGSVEVRFTGADASRVSSTRSAQSSGAAAYVWLNSTGDFGPRGSLRLDLDDLSSGGETFDGIPAGEYAARFFMANGGLEYPPRGEEAFPLLVEEGTTEFLIPTDGLGGIEIELVYPDGSPYLGPACFRLGEGPPELGEGGSIGYSVGSSVPIFDRAPYVFGNLPDGEFTLMLVSPPPAEIPSDPIGHTLPVRLEDAQFLTERIVVAK